VVGKSSKQECFKITKRLSVQYCANKKCVDDHNNFDWLCKGTWCSLECVRWRICFVCVQLCCSCTRHTFVRNVQVVYIPPNLTSTLQPLDLGIVRCFKQLNLKHVTEICDLIVSGWDIILKSCVLLAAAACLTAAAARRRVLHPTVLNCCCQRGYGSECDKQVTSYVNRSIPWGQDLARHGVC